MGPRTVAGVLALVTLALYAPVLRHAFVVYDDPIYVTDNPHVRAGLTVDGTLWAFVSMEASNWHPLTWLSHMADFQLYGMNAGGHHATSVVIHTATSVLLFVLLRRMTDELWRSAFVAALFAWHPLHVESVAWIAERKDVLSGLLFALTLLAYARYTERPSLGRYACVAGLFALGLMAKAMLVTLPVVLLLLDRWPLPRRRQQLVLEKLPLFGLAAAVATVTYVAQSASGAVIGLAHIPLESRIANALVSLATYLRMAFWPSGLTVFHTYDPQPALSRVAAAGAVVTSLSIVAWLARRRCPPIFVGWIWFLCMLVPVIGLVQAGEQGMADRYTYLPLVGVFIMVAWSTSAKPEPPRIRVALALVPVLSLTGCLVLSRTQLRHWKDSVALFEHAVEVTPNNALALVNLGSALLARGDVHAAALRYVEAAEQRPDWFPARFNAGVALAALGRDGEAASQLEAALRLEPGSAEAHFQLGRVLEGRGELQGAKRRYFKTLQLAPGHPLARQRLQALCASDLRPRPKAEDGSVDECGLVELAR